MKICERAVEIQYEITVDEALCLDQKDWTLNSICFGPVFVM